MIDVYKNGLLTFGTYCWDYSEACLLQSLHCCVYLGPPLPQDPSPAILITSSLSASHNTTGWFTSTMKQKLRVSDALISRRG